MEHANSIVCPSRTIQRRDLPDRRRFFSLINLRHLGFRARRRGGRRVGENRNCYVDRYEEPRLLFFSLAIIIMSSLDAVLTLLLLDLGKATELNPLMAALMEKGAMHFFHTKYVLTSLAVLLLVIHNNFTLLGFFRTIHLIFLLFSGFLLLIAYELLMLFCWP